MSFIALQVAQTLLRVHCSIVEMAPEDDVGIREITSINFPPKFSAEVATNLSSHTNEWSIICMRRKGYCDFGDSWGIVYWEVGAFLAALEFTLDRLTTAIQCTHEVNLTCKRAIQLQRPAHYTTCIKSVSESRPLAKHSVLRTVWGEHGHGVSCRSACVLY